MDILTTVGALIVWTVIDGFDVRERCAVLREESLKHRLQLGSELSREWTCELAATETGDGKQSMFALGCGHHSGSSIDPAG